MLHGRLSNAQTGFSPASPWKQQLPPPGTRKGLPSSARLFRLTSVLACAGLHSKARTRPLGVKASGSPRARAPTPTALQTWLPFYGGGGHSSRFPDPLQPWKPTSHSPGCLSNPAARL